MNKQEINNKIQEVLYNSVKIRNLVIREIPEEDIQYVADELTILVMNNFVLDPVSYDEIDISWLMDKHPELYENEAESLQQFCFDHTIRLKTCYGNGEKMYKKWKQR